MNRSKKILSAVLAGLLLLNIAALPAAASEMEIPEMINPYEDTPDPEQHSSWLDYTVPTEIPETVAETEPVQTIPAETEPEATPSAETVPDETTTAETVAAEETVPAEEISTRTYNSVPLYFQNDYPETMFGSGTVATSGCSITCLAMVATYLTGHEYLPDELAGYFGGRAVNNVARMEYGMWKLKLPYRTAVNWPDVRNCLEDGKIAILLVDEKSIFTDSQHFVVLTGITEDGLILVNDSNADNYERWDLKDKLITGFPESDIWKGYNGAWIFDKDYMPENPFIYKEEKVYVEPRYVGVTLTMDERELLARMVWVEARGESMEGQQAVAEVVLNRLYAGNFQDSIEEIIMAEGQFNSSKFLEDAEPYQTQYEAVERALKGPYVLPTSVVYFGQKPVNTMVWGWIGGHCFCSQWLPEE